MDFRHREVPANLPGAGGLSAGASSLARKPQSGLGKTKAGALANGEVTVLMTKAVAANMPICVAGLTLTSVALIAVFGLGQLLNSTPNAQLAKANEALIDAQVKADKREAQTVQDMNQTLRKVAATRVERQIGLINIGGSKTDAVPQDTQQPFTYQPAPDQSQTLQVNYDSEVQAWIDVYGSDYQYFTQVWNQCAAQNWASCDKFKMASDQLGVGVR
jgi:hypothetical protein